MLIGCLVTQLAFGMVTMCARSIVLNLLHEPSFPAKKFLNEVPIEQLDRLLKIITSENIQIPIDLLCKPHGPEPKGKNLYKTQIEDIPEKPLNDLRAIFSTLLLDHSSGSSEMDELIIQLEKVKFFSRQFNFPAKTHLLKKSFRMTTISFF